MTFYWKPGVKWLMHHRNVGASGHFLLCYIQNNQRDKICRTSLCNMFKLILKFYGFNMQKLHGISLSNAFPKNFCINITTTLEWEPALKTLKSA